MTKERLKRLNDLDKDIKEMIAEVSTIGSNECREALDRGGAKEDVVICTLLKHLTDDLIEAEAIARLTIIHAERVEK